MTDHPPLGPFARDASGPIPIARAALLLAVLAAAAATARPVLAGVDADASWLRPVGYGVAAVALAMSLRAFFVVSVRGVDGRIVSLIAMALAGASLIAITITAAVVDGTLRLDRVVDRYFDLELMRRVAPDIARGAVNTIRVTFLAEIFAVLLGLLVATFKLSPRRLLRWPAAIYVDVVRGLPIILLGTLVAFGLPAIGVRLGTFMVVGVTLVINASAYIAEIFRAGIQSLPSGQTDAARSLGMTQGAAMTYVVVPQASRIVIPPLMSEFIALIKDSAIVWAVAGFTVASRDLFNAANQGATATFSPTPLVAGAIGYLLVTIPLIQIVNRLERRVRTAS